MKKIKNYNSNFKIVLLLIVIIFSSITLLSLPVLFDYKSTKKSIEKLISSEFKINIDIESNISYKPFPIPHFLIEKATINLKNDKSKLNLIKTKKLKIYIPIEEIYSKSIKNISLIEINDSNIELKFDDIKNIRNHLKYSINKPIKINNSTVFILDENNDVILISPIKKLNYRIDEENKYKKFNILGNLFNIDFNSEWKRYYNKPKETFHTINIKNPNIKIKNEFIYENNQEYKGSSYISLIDKDIVINYEFLNNNLKVFSPDVSNNQEIKIFSDFQFVPFYFNSDVEINSKELNFLIDDFFHYFFIYNKEFLENLNGYLSFSFSNLKNQLIKRGKINFKFEEERIKFLGATFEIPEIGKINSKIKYEEKNGELVFFSENSLSINNHINFAKIFQINSKKIKKIKKINFNIKKKLDEKDFLISNIVLNDNQIKVDDNLSFLVKNIQELKVFARDALN